MRSRACLGPLWAPAVLFFAVGACCEEFRMKNGTRLSNQLLSGYSKSTLPAPDGGLQVEFTLSLGQFVSISTALEQVEFQGWWRMYWNDPRLSWDEDLWNIPSVSFEPAQVWLPDLTVFQQISDSRDPAMVTCYPDGSCQTSVPRRTKIGCSMNIQAFPYDSQKCNFTVGSWNYDGTRLDLLPRKMASMDEILQDGVLPERIPIDLESYKGFQEFSLASIKTVWMNEKYSCCEELFPILLIEFDIQRSTQTYIGGMIAPLLLVTFVGFFSLLMPAPPSGSRPAISVTIMLTTATVYFVASRSTPQSNQSTIIGRMYIAALGCSFVLVFVSIVTTALNLIQPEDPSQTKHLVDYFKQFDKNNDSSLDRHEFCQALTALGLDKGEQDKMMKYFMTDDDPTINLEQWKAFSSLTEKRDDAAVYHNAFVCKLIRREIEKNLKTSGKFLGRAHPTVARVAALQRRRELGSTEASSSEAVKKSTSTEVTTRAPVTQVASDLRANLAFQNMAPGPWQIPPQQPYGMSPGPMGLQNGNAQWVHGVSFGTSEWQPPRGQIPRASERNKHNQDDDARSWEAPDGDFDDLDLDAVPPMARSGSSFKNTTNAIGITSAESLSEVTRKVSRLLNNHGLVQNNPTRVGRELAAKVDKWARRLLPGFFALYLALEYAGAFSGEAVRGDLPTDSEGIVKPRIEFYDYRSVGDGNGQPGQDPAAESLCFRNFPRTKTTRNLFRAAESECDL